MQPHSWLRWKILLPLAMVILSICLMRLSVAEEYMIRGRGTGWDTPARVIGFLINGPGYLLTFWLSMPEHLESYLNHDGRRLPGVALFWFVIGLSLDRRQRRKSLSRNRPKLAIAIFGVAALLLGTLGVMAIDELHASYYFDNWRWLARFVLETFQTAIFFEALWLVAFSVYFVYKSYKAARILASERSTKRFERLDDLR